MAGGGCTGTQNTLEITSTIDGQLGHPSWHRSEPEKHISSRWHSHAARHADASTELHAIHPVVGPGMCGRSSSRMLAGILAQVECSAHSNASRCRQITTCASAARRTGTESALRQTAGSVAEQLARRDLLLFALPQPRAAAQVRRARSPPCARPWT